MKQITASLLLFIFSFNTIGGYLMLSVQRFEARREMLQHIKTHIPDSELKCIKITSKNKNDLHWKEANEFSYQGVMYDVVKFEKSKNQTTYFCVADHRETELLQQLEIQIDKDKSTKNNKKDLVQSLIKVIPRVQIETETKIAKISIHKNPISTEAFALYRSLKLDPINPPPKVI